jgi:hypothetical protein
MNIQLFNKKIEKDFFSHDNNTITIFDSFCEVLGASYTFSRLVNNLDWWNSSIIVNGDIIGKGEDPRAFNFNDIISCFSVKWEQEKGTTPQLFLLKDNHWQNIEIKFSISDINLGKNWSPFVYDEELYFIHEFSPFRILKFHEGEVTEFFVSDFYSEKQKYDGYNILRGGSNGLQIGDKVLGFGHTNIISDVENLYSIVHRPFLWILDMKNFTVQIEKINYEFEEEYNIVDPTSFFIKDKKMYLQTVETEFIWEYQPQNIRSCLYEVDII